jgi:hypothetical protein
MLVQDAKDEIQICRISRRGRIERIPLSEENEELFPEADRLDFYRVASMCEIHHIPAWYVPSIRRYLRPVQISITSPGKTLKAELIESYRERSDEDLELLRKYRAVKGRIIVHED